MKKKVYEVSCKSVTQISVSPEGMVELKRNGKWELSKFKADPLLKSLAARKFSCKLING